MKICMFIGYYPDKKGGAEYQARLLGDYLSKRHKVFFISYVYDTDRVSNSDGYTVYEISRSSLDVISLYQNSYPKIRNILQKEKPDIIYQRVLNGYTPTLARLSKSISTPLFVHIADNYSLQFNHSIRGVVRSALFRYIKRVYKSEFLNFIIQTEAQRNRLGDFGIIPCLKTYNAHPIGTTSIHKESIQQKFAVRKIYWIGSTRKVKQFQLFLSIVEKFITNKSYSFYMIGRFENNEYSNDLKRKASNLSNLLCLGEVNNTVVNQHLNEASLLLNTSYSEGFPNTFIQAWLRGVPVISLSVDPDLIIANNSLGLVCNSDLEKMADGIVRLLENYKLYSSSSQASFNFAFEHFTEDRIFGAIEKEFLDKIDLT